MHCYTRHFANSLFRERVQSGTGDGQVITLNNGEFVDLHFQLLARAAHQNTLLLQRADKLQNPADIVNGSATDLLGTFHYDLRTDPVAGEQFLQQCTIFLITDQMATAYATATGLHCPTQEAHRAGAVIAFLFLQLNTSLSFVRKQLGNNIAVIVGDTLRGAKADHFLGLQFDSQLRGDLL